MSEKISEYMIAWGEHSLDLTSNVNHCLQQGWSLYGSPYAITLDEDNVRHYQAMVKYYEE